MAGKEDDRSFKEQLALTARTPIPVVVYLNKVEVPSVIFPMTMAKILGIPVHEASLAIVVKGRGVIEVFNAITGRKIESFFCRHSRNYCLY